MQVRAIFEAATSVNDQGFKVLPEIMVPLIGTPQACILFTRACSRNSNGA